MRSGRAKLIAVLVLGLLLVIFVPPNINGTRFRDRLAPALSAALGRQVRIGAVKYRLFPRPGFDLYDFQVMDDPVFGAEPLLMCGKVTADLRLTSLWQGRLEFANLKLTDDAAPPSLNLGYYNGHWNLESLLIRAEQVPSAPTARRRAEQRPRFPYIDATGGRINFKNGPEKKSYVLANTDFAVWLAAEDVWHVRLEGHPVRTDMTLNDTGTLRLEGDMRRSPEFRDIPLKLSLSWQKTQLGQFSKLLMAEDRGWRGDLEGSAEVTGTPANLHIAATADLSHFHRYDVNRDTMPRLRARCLGDFVKSSLDLKCNTALDPGGVLLTARWSASTPFDYDLSLVADHIPVATLATLARHVRAALPDNLTATGDLNAAFGFHSHNGMRNWHGSGMSSPFLLISPGVDQPFAVSSLKFHVGAVDAGPAPFRKARQVTPSAVAQSNAFTIDPFSVQLGASTALEMQGVFDGSGYHLTAKGMVPLERLLSFGRMAGFRADTPSFNASAVVDLNVAGPWASAVSPRVRGTAHIQNLTAWIPGVKNRLVLTHAEAQLTDPALVLTHVSGEFEHSPVAFTGALRRPWSCQDSSGCPLEFDLHADNLSAVTVKSLLGTADKGWALPFLSGPGKLPEFRARGTLAIAQFTVSHIPLDGFTAYVEFGEQSLSMTRISAKLGNGVIAGDWRADWSGQQPRFTSSGTLAGVAVDRVSAAAGTPDLELMASWLTGKLDAKYSLHFEGKGSQEMFSSAAGNAQFTVSGGSSRALTLDGQRPLKFQTVEGSVEMDKGILQLQRTKIRGENRIYDVSGTVGLTDRQAKLKLVNGGSRWEITGTLEKPQIAAERLTAATSTHRQ